MLGFVRTNKIITVTHLKTKYLYLMKSENKMSGSCEWINSVYIVVNKWVLTVSKSDHCLSTSSLPRKSVPQSGSSMVTAPAIKHGSGPGDP